jgi:hypothetical protein
VSNDGLSALLGRLPANYSSDQNSKSHKAPRIDNNNPYKVAILVNGQIFHNIIVDMGVRWLLSDELEQNKQELDQV